MRVPERGLRAVSLRGATAVILPTAVALAEGCYEPTFGTSTNAAGQGEYLLHHIAAELRAIFRTGGKQRGSR